MERGQGVSPWGLRLLACPRAGGWSCYLWRGCRSPAHLEKGRKSPQAELQVLAGE